MRWDQIDQQVCSVARALAVVGDRWSLMILRDAFLGTRRFEEFQRQSGISRHRLSDRLNKLVEHGVFLKVKYQERPPRYEYRLTAMGVALQPVMLSLAAWGDQWCGDGNGPPVEYIHRSCGSPTSPRMHCSACGEPMRPAELTPVIGPGLEAALRDGRGMYTATGNAAAPSLPPGLRESAQGSQ